MEMVLACPCPIAVQELLFCLCMYHPLMAAIACPSPIIVPRLSLLFSSFDHRAYHCVHYIHTDAGKQSEANSTTHSQLDPGLSSSQLSATSGKQAGIGRGSGSWQPQDSVSSNIEFRAGAAAATDTTDGSTHAQCMQPPARRFESWLVLEHCDRGCISSYMAQRLAPARDSVSLLRVLQLLLDTAHGLQELHSRKVVHGDLVSGHSQPPMLFCHPCHPLWCYQHPALFDYSSDDLQYACDIAMFLVCLCR